MLEEDLEVSRQEAAGYGKRSQSQTGRAPKASPWDCTLRPSSWEWAVKKGWIWGKGWVLNRPFSATKHVYGNINSELRPFYRIY